MGGTITETNTSPDFSSHWRRRELLSLTAAWETKRPEPFGSGLSSWCERGELKPWLCHHVSLSCRKIIEISTFLMCARPPQSLGITHVCCQMVVSRMEVRPPPRNTSDSRLARMGFVGAWFAYESTAMGVWKQDAAAPKALRFAPVCFWVA